VPANAPEQEFLMKRTFMVSLLGLLALFYAGCATSFTGSAFVEDGRGGCEMKCREQGMELAGMVYMGEYSDACVCAVPGRAAWLKKNLVASSGAVAEGAAGVIMQSRRQQQNQQKY
jgi:hypothetical protein